jgi:hypothetical protein
MDEITCLLFGSTVLQGAGRPMRQVPFHLYRLLVTSVLLTSAPVNHSLHLSTTKYFQRRLLSHEPILSVAQFALTAHRGVGVGGFICDPESVALGHVGFPCQFSFRKMLGLSHISSSERGTQ